MVSITCKMSKKQSNVPAVEVDQIEEEMQLILYFRKLHGCRTKIYKKDIRFYHLII